MLAERQVPDFVIRNFFDNIENMAYDFSSFKKRLGEVELWLQNEFSGIRSGRATPSILDVVMVESYGSKMPVKHVASINVEDAKSLRVSPWDKSQIKGIEKGIMEANLGLSVSVDGDGLRVFFPDLTEERRKSLMKVAREKLEDARVSVRKVREDVWTDVQAKEINGDISEDDKFRLKDEMQKLVDASNANLDSLFDRKEKELAG